MTFVIISIFLLFSSTFYAICGADNSCGKRIIGYFTNSGGRQLTQEQGNGLTHLIYTENLQLDTEGNLYWKDEAHFNATLLAAKQFANLKFMVSYGSWNDDSMNLSTILATHSLRSKLSKNLIGLMHEYGLDGVEFDWEYNMSDKANFIEFLKEFRQLAAAEQFPNGPLLLTIVSGATPDDFFFMNRTEMNQVLDIVDFLSLKAYDYYGNWNYLSGPPSPLFDALPKDRLDSSEGKYADWTLRYYGCRADHLEKFNFLFSLHGYYWKSTVFPRLTDSAIVEDGMWRSVRAPFTGGVLYWRQIDTMFDRNMTIYNHRAEAPFIFDEPKGIFLGYENGQSIEAKINYIYKYGIGGIIVYAIDYDDDGDTLMRLIGSEMGKCDKVERKEDYNCSQMQDQDCLALNSTCTMQHLCVPASLVRGRCQSSLAPDVICCLGPIISANKANASQEQATLFIPLGVLIFLTIIIVTGICIFKKLKKPFGIFQTNSGSTTTTTTAVIRFDANSNDGLVMESENAAFDMQIGRNERQTFDPVSTFNDHLTMNELDNRWQFIQQNAASLVIRGKVFRGVNAVELERICELGRGNYGQVHKCRLRGNDLAIKRIKIRNDLEIKRALIDLKILRICRCKYIATYYGYLIDESNLYICMEAMATCLGKILENDLQRRRGLPETVIGKIANSVIRALEYLRVKHNLMHRDVKPTNILLGEDGIKLCDFGISGRLKESKAMLTTNVGALAYLAPERTYADKIYDIKADVWSLGISLVELATGVHPFEAPSELELIAKIQQSNAESILSANSVNSSLSTELVTFIKSCLHKEFSKRPDYKLLMNTPFLRLCDRIPVDVWLWYRRMKENLLKNALLDIC